MARPQKNGIDYFPFNTDIFSDRKMKRLLRTFGSKGYAIYTFLLCEIYRDNGYYILWDEDTAFDISDALLSIGVSEDLVKSVVDCCLKLNLFDAKMNKLHGILTSSGIQKRYSIAKRNAVIDPKFNTIEMVNTEETLVIAVETPVIAVETPTKQAESTQRKEKKSKVNKSKEEKPRAEPAFDFKKAILEHNVDEDLVDEFMALRKDKKATNSKRAFNAYLREVKASGYTLSEVVEKCCEKGWKGFEAIWYNKSSKAETKNVNDLWTK